RLKTVGRGGNRKPAIVLDRIDGSGICQRPAMGVIVGIEFENDHAMLRAVGDFVERVDVGKGAAKTRARSLRVDVNIEPDRAIVLTGELKDLLMSRKSGDARGGAGKIERILNGPAISEVSHNKGDVRVFGPNGFGEGFELLPVGFIHP